MRPSMRHRQSSVPTDVLVGEDIERVLEKWNDVLDCSPL